MTEAPVPIVCIGCGCSDTDACTDEFGVWRCSWLFQRTMGHLQESRGIRYRPGLCTSCRDSKPKWDAQDWQLSEAAAERARRGLSTTNDGKVREVNVCKSCGARIYFMDTKAGKTMPVDVDTVGPDEFTYIHKKHRSHYATCSHPDRHRRVR